MTQKDLYWVDFLHSRNESLGLGDDFLPSRSLPLALLLKTPPSRFAPVSPALEELDQYSVPSPPRLSLGFTLFTNICSYALLYVTYSSCVFTYV